ncbi:MAG: hypothetical protein PHX83_12410 [Acidobacteriia bacterium]|nr:hypothetical protein [Terriglobia bacterium]
MRNVVKIAVLTGLVAMASNIAVASINYNSSKSNSGNIVLVYPEHLVTAPQAAAILSELEKTSSKGPVRDETVRGISKKLGVQIERIKLIKTTSRNAGPDSTKENSKNNNGAVQRKSMSVIFMLENPEDEPQAIKASQR